MKCTATTVNTIYRVNTCVVAMPVFFKKSVNVQSRHRQKCPGSLHVRKTRPKGFYGENVEVYPNERAGESVSASLFTRAIVKRHRCVIIYPEFCVLRTDHAERSKVRFKNELWNYPQWRKCIADHKSYTRTIWHSKVCGETLWWENGDGDTWESSAYLYMRLHLEFDNSLWIYEKHKCAWAAIKRKWML